METVLINYSTTVYQLMISSNEQLDFTSKVDAIHNKGSTIMVVTPMYENSTGKLVLDNSSRTVYSKFELSDKVETMILKNEEFFYKTNLK